MKKSNSKVKFSIGKSLSSESLNSIIETSTSTQLTPPTDTKGTTNEDSLSNDSISSSPDHSNESNHSDMAKTAQHLRYVFCFVFVVVELFRKRGKLR